MPWQSRNTPFVVLRELAVGSAGASRASQIDDAGEASTRTLTDDVVSALEAFAAPAGGSLR